MLYIVCDELRQFKDYCMKKQVSQFDATPVMSMNEALRKLQGTKNPTIVRIEPLQWKSEDKCELDRLIGSRNF